MYLLNLLFQKKWEDTPIKGDIKRILVIRTDERLGEVILTLPLINHLKKVYRGAEITFLMSKRYERLFNYIHCDRIIPFEKREFIRNFFRFIRFITELRMSYYDIIVIGGKIKVPSLTSYLLLWLAKGRYKVAIKNDWFNPFINVAVPVNSLSEPLSKSELAVKITGVSLPFDNSLRTDGNVEKTFDLLIFTDARKRDHLLPLDTICQVIDSLHGRGLRLIIVSGLESKERIAFLKDRYNGLIEFSLSPDLDELIRLIKMSRAVLVANTGVMHLSVALRVPTCAIFISASPDEWGYGFLPHLMIDARNKGPDINEIVNFVLSSIKRPEEGV